MTSGCGVLRCQCLQLHKCTLSKTPPKLKVGGREKAHRPGGGCLPSPAILHLPLKPASPGVSPSQLVAAPSFWMPKPKPVQTPLTPLFLSHPHPTNPLGLTFQIRGWSRKYAAM